MKKKILEKWEKNGARNAAENYTQEGKTCALSGSFVQTSPHVTSPYDSLGPPPKLLTTPYHSVPFRTTPYDSLGPLPRLLTTPYHSVPFRATLYGSVQLPTTP